MNRLLVACGVALVTLTALAGCAGEDDATVAERGRDTRRFPKQNRDAFVESCAAQQGATVAACERVLQCLEGELTFGEFTAGERRMLRGEENAAYMDVLTDCAERSTPRG